MPHYFTKRLVPAGTFEMINGQRVNVTTERLEEWAKKHGRLREKGKYVPLPKGHFTDDNKPTDTPPSKHLDKVWLAGDGWLTGQLIAATDEDANEIVDMKHVSIGTMNSVQAGDEVIEDVIAHVALTKNPVVKNQGDPLKTFEDNTIVLAFSADGMVEDTESDDKPITASVESAIKVLSDLGLALPEDTVEGNFIDRVVTVGNALLHSKKQEGDDETDVDEPPKGATTRKPAPIAMSKEIQFALDLLQENGILDGDQPYTEESLKAKAGVKTEPEVRLSADQEAMLTLARKNIIDGVKNRIQGYVNSGDLPKPVAEKIAKEMLPKHEIRFSKDGEPIKQPLDHVLDTIEMLGAGSQFKNTSRQQVRMEDGQFVVNFSEGDDYQILDPPQQTVGSYREPTDAEAEALADELFA